MAIGAVTPPPAAPITRLAPAPDRPPLVLSPEGNRYGLVIKPGADFSSLMQPEPKPQVDQAQLAREAEYRAALAQWRRDHPKTCKEEDKWQVGPIKVCP